MQSFSQNTFHLIKKLRVDDIYFSEGSPSLGPAGMILEGDRSCTGPADDSQPRNTSHHIPTTTIITTYTQVLQTAVSLKQVNNKEGFIASLLNLTLYVYYGG